MHPAGGLNPTHLVKEIHPHGLPAPDTAPEVETADLTGLFRCEEPSNPLGGLRLLTQRDVYAIEVVGHGFAETTSRPRGFDDCASFVAAAVRAFSGESPWSALQSAANSGASS